MLIHPQAQLFFLRNERMRTILFPFSFQKAKSLIKLTSNTFVSSSSGLGVSEGRRALCMNLRSSQFVLAPRTLVKRIREASEGRRR